MTSKPDLIIRPALRTDASGILSAHRAAVLVSAQNAYDQAVLDEWAATESPERLAFVRTEIASSNIIVLVAEVGGRVVGFAMAVPEASELRAVYVHADFGGQGIGARLLDALEGLAAERGALELAMDASLNAVAFYQRMGYQVVAYGEHELRSGARMKCARMRKMLKRRP